MASPGGTPSAFWEAVRTRSTPPLLGRQFLPAHAADAVHDDQRAVAAAQFCQGPDVAQDGGGGVHVGDGHQFVVALGERGLHRLQGRRIPDGGRLQRSDLRAAPLQDGDVPVAEVAGDEDQRAVARLYQVGRRHLHRQGAGPGDDEGLAVGEEEDLFQPVQRLPEDLHEVGSQVAGGGEPHGRQHLRRELHGSGNHQEFAVFHWDLRVRMQGYKDESTAKTHRRERGERRDFL